MSDVLVVVDCLVLFLLDVGILLPEMTPFKFQTRLYLDGSTLKLGKLAHYEADPTCYLTT